MMISLMTKPCSQPVTSNHSNVADDFESDAENVVMVTVVGYNEGDDYPDIMTIIAVAMKAMVLMELAMTMMMMMMMMMLTDDR